MTDNKVREIAKRITLLRWLVRTLRIIWHTILRDPLNKGHRVMLIRNYFLWFCYYKKVGREQIIVLQNGMRSKVYPDSDSGVENIYTVNVDYWENAFIRSQLKTGNFIVDAGCNVGNRTLVLSDIIGGALLLDANDACLKRLRDNFLLNGINLTNYHIVNKAVGAELKSVQFTNLGGTSCWNKIHEGPNSDDVHSRIIEMTTVDNEMAKLRNPQCSFMKFDLEGRDYYGLLGAKETLETDSMKLVQFERWANVDLQPIEDFFDSISWFIFALDANGKPTLDRKVITTALNLFATKNSLLRQILRNG